MAGKTVLITGAGLLGNATAIAFRRKGYDVYIIVRSAEKAKRQELNEIKPIFGDALKPETYADVLHKADIVVNTAASGFNLDAERQIYEAVFQGVRKSNAAGNPKKRVIFSSGGMVFVSNKNALVTEESPTSGQGFPFLQGRIDVDNAVLANKDAITSVLRFPFLLGGEDGHHTETFKQAEEGKVVIPGDGNNVLAHVHIEDAAHAVVATAEADAGLVAGQLFLVASDTAPKLSEVVKAFAAAAGYTGPFEHGPFSAPLYDIHIGYDCSKIKRVLGWRPTRPDILKEAPVMYKAWKAGGYPAKF